MGQGRLIFREISVLWGRNADLREKGTSKGSVEQARHLSWSPKASSGMWPLLAQLGL